MSELQLMEIKARERQLSDHFQMDWQTIRTAPFNRDLELAVIDASEVYALVFPCRRSSYSWVNAKTNSPVDVHQTHWRDWDDSVSRLFSRPAC